jgi:hypothetical protein
MPDDIDNICNMIKKITIIMTLFICISLGAQHLSVSTTNMNFGNVDSGFNRNLRVFLGSIDGKTANISTTWQLQNIVPPRNANYCASYDAVMTVEKFQSNPNVEISSQTGSSYTVVLKGYAFRYLGPNSLGGCDSVQTNSGLGNYSATLRINYSGSQQGSPSGVSGTINIPISATVVSAPRNTSSTSEIAIQEVNIYPNPASTSITINVLKAQEVKITRICGKTWITQFIQNMETIDISSLQSGVYIVQGEHFSRKIIID